MSRQDQFDEIVGSAGPAIQRLCATMERNPEASRELQQEILATIWHALPSFRGDSTARTWALRVAHNVAARHIRRDVRRPPSSDTEPDDLPSASGEPDLDRARALAHLKRAIRDLPVLDRQLVLLSLEEISSAEIAQITGLSRTNVTSRLHRARQKLKRALTMEVRHAG